MYDRHNAHISDHLGPVVTAQDERRLLADYDARVDHQKHYGRTMMGDKAIRQLRRELAELGLDVDAPKRANPTSRTQWYMSELGGSKRHAERDCLGLCYTTDDQIRPCTQAEML